MRWRLGEASGVIDSREVLSGFRTTPVTKVADLKQFDCPHFFCKDVSHSGASGVCSWGVQLLRQVTGYEQRNGGRGRDPKAEESRNLQTDRKSEILGW